jgi:hypothetical protein
MCKVQHRTGASVWESDGINGQNNKPCGRKYSKDVPMTLETRYGSYNGQALEFKCASHQYGRIYSSDRR